MSSMTPEIGLIFQYGFLTSSVSRLLAIYKNKPLYKLSPGNKSLLKRGTLFMDEILKSQELVKGRGHMPPSAYGLDAFQHAVSSLPKFFAAAVNSSQKRQDLFEKIKTVLQDMASEQQVQSEDDIDDANLFFGAIADLYLTEVQQTFRTESFSRPK